ncbi:MAG: methyl-accepting chemotaxis protein [Leptolyngbya sp. SIO1D8]|nr:methyl-accepting chemotaxis protein [Leptolyngbya sp. SIO1D8]
MAVKLFGRFVKVNIQTQLLALLLLSTTIPVAVGLYGAFSFTRATANNSLAEFQDEADAYAHEAEIFFKGIDEELLFFTHLPELEGIIESRANGGTDDAGRSVDDWKQQLSDVALALIKAKPDMQKFRYIDETGQEIIRVERDGQNRDLLTIISEAELQNQSDRPYFQAGMTLEPDTVWISPINLQQEGGVIVEPYLPIVRHVAAVYDQAGNRKGVIVLNLFADKLTHIVDEYEAAIHGETDESDGAEGQADEQHTSEDHINLDGKEIFVVNTDGYYLANADVSKEWGFDLDHEETLQNDFSEAVADIILSGDEGVFEQGNFLYAYAKADLNPNQEGEHFYVVERLSKGFIYRDANAFLIVAALVMLVALVITLPLGILRGRQLINIMKGLVNIISTTSQQIFSTISEQERIAAQQATSVNETTTTMEELEASSRQSAEQALTAAEAAKSALERAETGTEALGQTLEGMFTLEQKVDAIAQQIVYLSSQAGQIGNISNLVSDFANQTNMLALNSSVEAVRAGEYGKGFAVVANEIRKLADQSQGSADKIKALVEDIQRAINETVMVTEEGTKTVRSSVATAKYTEETFDDIKQGITEVVMNNQQVSLTQKQQVDAIRQVVTAMEMLDQSALESATGLTQTRNGTEQLNQEALSLQSIL